MEKDLDIQVGFKGSNFILFFMFFKAKASFSELQINYLQIKYEDYKLINYKNPFVY